MDHINLFNVPEVFEAAIILPVQIISDQLPWENIHVSWSGRGCGWGRGLSDNLHDPSIQSIVVLRMSGATIS